MPVMIAAGTLGVIAYAVGRVDFTEYLDVHYVPGTGELADLHRRADRRGLGFLWYNAPPAAVFMGDTGSLALGGALGAIAVATKHEIVLAIVGGLFVVEALSVIIQVAYFKDTGKRVFLMAPIHHHFEKQGWAEPQIVIRFWIISLILALIGLATLKLRARRGRADVVNNAGILETVPFLGDNDNFARSMQVMVHAPFELMRAVIPGMAARGHGRIVNVSSGWGSFAEGLNGGGAYGIAKAALNALTLRAAQEVSPCIKVNAMCPGWVQTRMGGAGAPRSPEAGAATAIWLATLPADGPTGGFFRDRRPVPW
jgi:hypothetical protein